MTVFQMLSNHLYLGDVLLCWGRRKVFFWVLTSSLLMVLNSFSSQNAGPKLTLDSCGTRATESSSPLLDPLWCVRRREWAASSKASCTRRLSNSAFSSGLSIRDRDSSSRMRVCSPLNRASAAEGRIKDFSRPDTDTEAMEIWAFMQLRPKFTQAHRKKWQERELR